MKDKTAKMKHCVAGAYIPRERATELVEAALGFDAPDGFIGGIAFACAFLSCKKDDYRFGMNPTEFYANDPVLEEPPTEVVSKAHEIIDQLKGMGVEVVSAYIVEGVR